MNGQPADLVAARRPTNPDSGLTAEEAAIMDHLIAAWNGFVRLPQTHPDHQDDFRRVIHAAERILATRALARLLPAYWGAAPRAD